jgi:hypothetical protein
VRDGELLEDGYSSRHRSQIGVRAHDHRDNGGGMVWFWGGGFCAGNVVELLDQRGHHLLCFSHGWRCDGNMSHLSAWGAVALVV